MKWNPVDSSNPLFENTKLNFLSGCRVETHSRRFCLKLQMVNSTWTRGELDVVILNWVILRQDAFKIRRIQILPQYIYSNYSTTDT